MKISEIAIKRKIMTLMGVLALVLLGTVTVFRISLSMMPDVDFPFVTVQTVLPGAAPDVVESDVSDKLEEAISNVSGIKTLNSFSRESISFVFIEFRIGEDVDLRAQEVRDKISLIRNELPDDTEEPNVQKLDVNEFPILVVIVEGDRPIAELTDYCERTLKSTFQSVSGVGRIEILGGRKREIRLWIDPILLEAKDLAVSDVEAALVSNHIDMAGGRIETSGVEYIVKTKGEVARPTDFEDIPVAYRNGSPIRIRDIGRVDDGLEENRSASRLNGRNAIGMQIFKKSGANIVEIAKGVKARVADVNETMPAGINRLIITQDTSVFTETSLAQTRNDLLLGGLLAVLILFVFLRDWRGTIIAGSVIPAAIISSFILVFWFGFTFNVLTLMSYTICVGMLIDDAIVMVEVIHRFLKKGQSPLEAAMNGSSEIGFAVVATSLTVMAVFVPIAFTEGLIGQFLFEFGITVTVVVAISTLFALTLTPTFAAVLFKPHEEKRPSFLSAGIENLLQLVERSYRRMLTFSIENRWVIVVLCILLFAGSILLAIYAVDEEFEPQMDIGESSIAFELPIGTPLDQAVDLAAALEKHVEDYSEGAIQEIYTTIGGGAFGKVNQGSLYIKMQPKGDRAKSQFEIQDDLRALLQGEYPDSNIKVTPFDPAGDLKGAAIQLSVRGPEFDQLQEIVAAIIAEMRMHKGFIEIDTSFETGKPEIPLHINREAAAREGVSVASIAMTVNSLVAGVDVTTYKEDGKQYDVRLRLKGQSRNSIEDIYNLSVRSPLSGKLIRLRALLETVTAGTGYAQISRGDRQREITVLANLDQKVLKLGPATELMNAICWGQGLAIKGEKNKGLDKSKAIPGYSAKYLGTVEIMKESFASLALALMIGIVFIYIVLAAQFNKLLPPLAIMFSLPLSVVGIFTAMWLTGQSMNIMAQISIIMLMGLVAKNAILLIDYTELLRGQGRDRKDAIIDGGTVRLRPILMTAFSTIFGMLPAALSQSEGAEMRQTMAICAIGGLITSTFLTLIVIPVAYSILDDMGRSRFFQVIAKIMISLIAVTLLVVVTMKYLLGIEF